MLLYLYNDSATAYLLHHEPASYFYAAKVKPGGEAVAKASLNRAQVVWSRPEARAIYPWSE